jgi:carbonic anhydrase
MHKIIDGVARYTSEIHPNRQPLFDRLATGQSPEVLFLTCADSRIDPSLITQTDPGDIFVCRNAGNIVPRSDAGLAAEGMAASIEFAIKALRVSMIVVCGHADCGAVKGAMYPDSVTELPQVAAWVGHADTGGNSDLNAAIEANVLTQIDNLWTYDFVAEAVAAGTLQLAGWVYDIGSGSVKIHDGDRFVNVAELVGSGS